MPKEGIGSAGRVPREQVRGSAAQAAGTGVERVLWAVRGDSHGASGLSDAQRRPPSGSTVGDAAGNIQGQWGGRPPREGWGRTVAWTHGHQGLGRLRKGGCTVLCTLPGCNSTFTQRPPASGSRVTSRAYWLPSVGTKVKTIQIPPSKWSPQQETQRAGHQRPRLQNTCFFSYSCCPGNIIQPKDKTGKKKVSLNFFLCTAHHHILWGPLQSPC